MAHTAETKAKVARARTIVRPAVIDGDCARIPLTRGMWAIVDIVDCDLSEVSWFAATARHVTYAWRHKARPSRDKLQLHRVIALRMGLSIDGHDIDHIDGDGLNNRRSNLRIATAAQNQWNRGRRRSDNASGVTGVCWDKRRGKWRAEIAVNRKRIHLGHFATLSDAAFARGAAAARWHGEFTRREA